MKYLKLMLVFIPATIIARYMCLNEGLIFLFASLSIVPLAVIIGDATEQIALYTNPKVGGMLNATMGNIPELLIGIFAVRAGMYDLVLASMAGSIIGNVLLVLGFSIFLGGLKYKFQTFNKNNARANFTLLTFAAITIVIPFAFKYTAGSDESINDGITGLSLGISVIILGIYILGLVFSLITHKNMFAQHDEREEVEEKPSWKFGTALAVLAAAALIIAFESETLVATVEHAVKIFGISKIFIGIILIPILGNVAEHASAMIMAVKNKVDISVEIAVGSSMQISLFVAPVLVLISFLIGRPMAYVYSPFVVVSLLIGIIMSVYVFQDGKTNWLEGIQLVGCYIILGLAFFFM